MKRASHDAGEQICSSAQLKMHGVDRIIIITPHANGLGYFALLCLLLSCTNQFLELSSTSAILLSFTELYSLFQHIVLVLLLSITIVDLALISIISKNL